MKPVKHKVRYTDMFDLFTVLTFENIEDKIYHEILMEVDNIIEQHVLNSILEDYSK